MSDKTDLKFGISLSGGLHEWISALKIIDVSIFDKVELPGECMDSRANRSSLESTTNDIFKIFAQNKRRFEVISVTDIAPAVISGEMAEQSSGIREDFVENIRLSLTELAKLGIKACSLNIAPETTFDNEEKRERKIMLLKRITPFLYDKKINLSIPVRMPSVSDLDFGNYLTFAREAMSPYIKLSANIHPHEIKNKKTPAELLCPFRFLMDSISFIYEPEAGNILVDELMMPWFELLDKYQFSGTVIFVPRTSNIAIFSREISRITSIMENFQIKKSAN